MSWDTSAARHADNARLLKTHIERDHVGRTLTPQAQQAAAEFAADVWQGRMGAGEAARIGIQHVTKDVLR